MIAGGHQLTEIRNYTLAQTRAYMGAIERARKDELAGLATAMNAAQDARVLRKYLATIQK